MSSQKRTSIAVGKISPLYKGAGISVCQTGGGHETVVSAYKLTAWVVWGQGFTGDLFSVQVQAEEIQAIGFKVKGVFVRKTVVGSAVHQTDDQSVWCLAQKQIVLHHTKVSSWNGKRFHHYSF